MFAKLKDKLFNEDHEKCAVDLRGTVRIDPIHKEHSCIQSVQKEYDDFIEVLKSNPATDDSIGWNWFCGKLAYYKIRGLDRLRFKELSIYGIKKFPKQYAENFISFLKIIESVSLVTAACEQMLLEQRAEEAMAVAKICMTYLKERTDLYPDGQLCFSSMEEAILYAAERGDRGENRADDNYAGFFLCYANILMKQVLVYEELQEDAKKEIAFCLDHAERLSPCNASLWELRSRTYRASDQKKYMECIRKALLYSIPNDKNNVLGNTYANLATYYSTQNYALADALCILSAKHGGDPGEVEFIISGCQYDSYPDAELAVHQAGIQVGYSSLVYMAKEKANEYWSLPQEGEIKAEHRKMILSASDSAYQYEVRDPMTVVGRTSAMSEYLKLKPTVSRVHARLIKEDDQLFVSDMDAMNGTYVNGIRIGTHRQILHEGDELRLGSSSERGARFTMKTEK